MAKVDMERVNEYLIPMNFIDESRFLNGIFKTRNFVEGSIMGGTVGIIFWALISAPFEAKLSLIIGIAFPFFMLGLSGINGDAFSTFVFNALTWVRTRGTMLYNNETRALAQAPLATMMEEEGMNDKILDILDSFKERSQKKRANTPLVEGRDFVFAEDTALAGNYLDEVDDEDVEPKGKRRKVTSKDVDTEPEPKASSAPIFAVEVQEVDVSVEPVRITSNVDKTGDDSLELFSTEPLEPPVEEQEQPAPTEPDKSNEEKGPAIPDDTDESGDEEDELF